MNIFYENKTYHLKEHNLLLDYFWITKSKCFNDACSLVSFVNLSRLMHSTSSFLGRVPSKRVVWSYWLQRFVQFSFELIRLVESGWNRCPMRYRHLFWAERRRNAPGYTVSGISTLRTVIYYLRQDWKLTHTWQSCCSCSVYRFWGIRIYC